MNVKIRLVCIVILSLFLVPSVSKGQDGAENIRLNQLGYYPSAPKEAVIVGASTDEFRVVKVPDGNVVFSGVLDSEQVWSFSGETVRLATFSSLEIPGTYAIEVDGVGTSYPFEIDGRVHEDVARASLKALYFQRVSSALSNEHADVWARPKGHPDTSVLIHASAASPERPVGTTISAPYGWYDAGDFNKYIVNSGISTYTILSLFEHYEDFAGTLETNIPESDNEVPDILDEAYWNLRWIMAMQDPHDGGIYHKLTHASFQGIVMPHTPTAARYVVQKGTGAALNFTAVMAQAARIYASFPDAFPGMADSMRTAALRAWEWARRNPNVSYDQNSMNQTYEPDVVTGAYGDSNFEDEFDWAAAELFVTTGADSFLTISTPLDQGPDIPWWGGVRSLGWYTLLHHRDKLASIVDTTAMVNQYLSFARGLADSRYQVPYRTVMGKESWHFGWGSNGGAANQGMALLQAFRLSADSTFLWAALSNLDYLLGRNAIGMSFVTGHGSNTPLHPHHRQSEADTVSEPVPGLLVGGPNPGQQDGCVYQSDLPARSYVDDWCSYASNEIAINWNTPFTYLAAGLEAELGNRVSSTNTDGIEQSAVPQSILLPPYPNPALYETTLMYEIVEPRGDVKLEAFDILGRRVAKWSLVSDRGRRLVSWKMNDLPGGLYIVRLVTGERSSFQKVMKLTD